MRSKTTGKAGTIQAVSSGDLNKIRGGESFIFNQNGFSVNAIGDDVDINTGEGFVNVTSGKVSNSNGNFSSSTSSTTLRISGSNSYVNISSYNQ